MFKPNHDTAKLTDIAIIIMGQSPASADCNETAIGLPLLNGPTEFGPHHPTPVQFTTDAKRIAEKGDLLFCVRGSTTGRMNWADRGYAIGRGLASIRSKDGPQSSPFVRAVIEYKLDEMLTAATGSTFPNVSREQLGGIQFPLPPLPEQRRIAKILGDLDDKIELNRTMNETLEQMARVLFKSWFVDFDPVRAKMEGRTPTGMDAATAALFPDRLVDSELGMIPEGWEVKALGEVVECVGGGTPSTKESRFWENGQNSWATPKDLAGIDVPILIGTERCITDAGLARVLSGLLPAGTLLMSSRAPVGYLAVSAINVAINQGFIAMRSNDSVSSYYMLQWCTTNLEEIRNRASGTTFAEISKASFRQMRMVLPPSELMRCYTEAAIRYYEKITSNIHQSRTLSTLRDTLLPKLVSGEVRVGGLNYE